MTDPNRLPSAMHQLEPWAAQWARHRMALFLDYDGTLTPIVGRPEAAILSEDMRRLLASLAQKHTVTIVSGRDRADVTRLVGVHGIYYIGSHGFEIAGPGELHFEHEDGLARLPALSAAADQLSASTAGMPGVTLERKRFALAVHYRNAPDDSLPALKVIAEEILRSDTDLRVSYGKKVMELRPDTDWNKGHAVRWLINRLRLDGHRAPCMYIGDDLTDEDAFVELAQDSITILVGDHGAPTRAQWRLRDVCEVQALLSRIDAWDTEAA